MAIEIRQWQLGRGCLRIDHTIVDGYGITVTDNKCEVCGNRLKKLVNECDYNTRPVYELGNSNPVAYVHGDCKFEFSDVLAIQFVKEMIAKEKDS